MKHLSIPFKKALRSAGFTAAVALLALSSCTNPSDCKKCIEDKPSGEFATLINAKNHFITNKEASTMTEAFKNNITMFQTETSGNVNEVFPLAETFNLKTIDSILCQENTVGLRVYLALGEDKKVHFVLVGAHPDGKDVLMTSDRANASQETPREEVSAENGQRWP